MFGQQAATLPNSELEILISLLTFLFARIQLHVSAWKLNVYMSVMSAVIHGKLIYIRSITKK